MQYSLYQRIDMSKLTCLNETVSTYRPPRSSLCHESDLQHFLDFQVENSGRLVFKPWERRLDKTECVESDADEELLINIPFTGDVKLKGLIVIGGEDDTHPDKVGIYLNL